MSSSSSEVQAAGGIIWRTTGRRLEVLLIHRPKYDDWSFPKGKLDAGESLPQCAVREIAEETGLDVALGQPLPAVRYRVAEGRRKVVHYWAAQETGPPAEAAERPEDDENAGGPRHRAAGPLDLTEVDETRWVEARAAWSMLTNAHDRAPLEHLIDQWRDEKLRTWTLVVLRHSRAMKRSAWRGDEDTRPLTGGGSQRAQHLVPLLVSYGINEVITSPWERCAATVRPFLEATGVGASLAEELTESAHKARPKLARRLIRHELITRDVPVVICTHRPVLPTLIEEIAARTPHRLRKRLPQDDPYLKTGEMLVVHVAQRTGRGATVVALESHRSPR